MDSENTDNMDDSCFRDLTFVKSTFQDKEDKAI